MSKKKNLMRRKAEKKQFPERKKRRLRKTWDRMVNRRVTSIAEEPTGQKVKKEKVYTRCQHGKKCRGVRNSQKKFTGKNHGIPDRNTKRKNDQQTPTAQNN